MMAQELSPSEYEKMLETTAAHKPKPSYIRPALLVAAAIILCGISFLLGENYQKHHSTSTGAGQFGSQSQAGGPGGFGGRQMRGSVGTVSAVSSDSITIKTVSGDTKTYKITSSTTVENDGSTGSVSDIKTGDTVAIRTESSDSSTASRILLNADMPPNQSGDTGQSDTTGSSDSSTLTN
jgi:hypothetical protein